MKAPGLLARVASGAATVALSIGASAAPFSEVRIGDIDGFGYGAGTSSCFGGICEAANGGPANVGTGGVLGAETLPTVGDFLPDLDGSGATGPNSADTFDNRDGETVGGAGYTDTGTSGADFTDISLSTRYADDQEAGAVYDANTGERGPGGDFPDGTPKTLSNQPGFAFRFAVPEGDIDPGAPIFFNVVFGDFGVTPFELDLEFAGGVTETLNITPQNNAAGEDGLIQASFSELAFDRVFSRQGDRYEGYLDVTFDAPNEPYTAYDFVELSTRPISTNEPVPAPGTLGLLALAAGGLLFGLRDRAGSMS